MTGAHLNRQFIIINQKCLHLIPFSVNIRFRISHFVYFTISGLGSW